MSDHRLAEQNSPRTEDVFSTIFNLSPFRMGLFRLKDGVVLEVNETWVRDTGFSRDEIVGRSIFDFREWLEPDATAMARRLMLERVPLRDVEARVRNKFGDELVVVVSAEIITVEGEACALWVSNDITERKRAEESLRLSEERFALAFHASPEPISIRRHRDGVLLEVNDKWRAVYGYSREEAVGRTAGEIGLITREELRRLRELRSEQSQLREFEVDLVSKQSEIRHVSLSCEPIVINDELCDLFLHRDVTDTRQAEEKNRRLIHHLGERVKELTALHRSAQILQTPDPSVSVILREIANLLPPAFQYPEVTAARVRLGAVECSTAGFRDDRPILASSFNTNDGQTGSIEVVYLVDRPNAAEGSFLKEERALIETIAEMLHTDYDRRYSESALRESDHRFLQLVGNIRQVLWLRSPDFSRVLYISPAYEIVWGRSCESLQREPFSFLEAVHPDERTRVTEIVRDGIKEGLDHEYRIIRPDGSTRWIWDRGFPITDEHGQVYQIAGVAEDITDRKQAERELKTSEERLRALSAKMQSAREEEGARIAREIHDELGSALTGLKWDLEKIDKALSGDAGAEESQIRERLAAMNTLIDSTITTVRRISSDLRPGLLDDLGVVAAIEWQAQQIEARSDLKCHWDSEMDNVELDRDRATAVFRIFQEILTNILRHSGARNFYVKLRENRKQFWLEVRDDGRGITESEKGNTRTLGLLGMKERAMLVGGKVHISGANRQGTTVVVCVPLQAGRDNGCVENSYH